MSDVTPKSKYPIVLVHGIVLKDVKFFKAFGRIEKKLKSEGYRVFTAKTDGFGKIETNAEQLQSYIDGLTISEKAEKVNIIAHSKGGLDSRYLIERLGFDDKIASLTTLCTPHKGSPIASFILRFPKWLLKFIAFWINLTYRIFGDKHPDALAVCEQLRLNTDAEFTDFSDKIYCQSYSTVLDKSRDDFVMGIPLMFSKKLDSDKSDGLVTVESAKFGTYRGSAVDGSVSHSEIVDFMAKKKKKERIYAFYSGICAELAAMGF